MDRYKIAIKKYKKFNEKIYRFPATRYSEVAYKYLERCITDDAILLANNILRGALERAIIKVSRIYNVLIVMNDKTEARLLTLAYSYEFYSLQDFPISVNNKYVLCYNCMKKDLPPDYNAIGIVYNHLNLF